jgi:ferredoxin
MRLPEAVVGGPRGCRGGQEEAFLKGRQVLNEELEHAVDLFGDTDPADGWPSVIALTRTREKNKSKKGRTVETGRIIAGFRFVDCGSAAYADVCYTYAIRMLCHMLTYAIIAGFRFVDCGSVQPAACADVCYTYAMTYADVCYNCGVQDCRMRERRR